MRSGTRRVLIALVALVVALACGYGWWKGSPARHARAATRLKLIDDFSDKAEANLIGGDAFTQTSSPDARITTTIEGVKTPSPGDLALVVAYDVPAHEHVAWGTRLNDLDISAATALRFQLEMEGMPSAELTAELVDAQGTHAQVPVHPAGSGRWKTVEVARRDFSGINFEQLGAFVLHITAGDARLTGQVRVDDLAFIGPPEIFTRSLEDNLYASPRRVFVNAKRLAWLPPKERLRAVAADTWGYFRDAVDRRHQLPLNFLQLAPERQLGDYVSPTDISMYLMSVVSALDFELIDRAEALARVRGTLERVQQLPKWRHFLHNYYSTTNLQITSRYISSVDNGWLAAALIVVRQEFPELAGMASGLLNPMDFSVLYDPKVKQMRLGYDLEKEQYAPYHYGLLVSEARIVSVIGIGKGDIPEEHWYQIYRTLPKEWDWQRQVPHGASRSYGEHDVFEGYYLVQAGTEQVPLVPSWGGSLFEFLMPTLVIDEQGIAPRSLGLNDARAVALHRDYATNVRGLPVWGISPCATPKGRHGGYGEYGIAALAVKGYTDEGVVTPHVSMLALPFASGAAEENIRQFLTRYKMYGPYGIYDAVDATTGDVAYRYLALDQGMTLIALNNYLNHGAIQKRFQADPIMQRVERLLQEERFF